MLKLILLLLWPPSRIHDAEFNIEAMSVKAVERKDARTTLISYQDTKGEWQDYCLPCTLEKHSQLVARFRKKIGLTP